MNEENVNPIPPTADYHPKESYPAEFKKVRHVSIVPVENGYVVHVERGSGHGQPFVPSQGYIFTSIGAVGSFVEQTLESSGK